jgi:hypothetical protein
MENNPPEYLFPFHVRVNLLNTVFWCLSEREYSCNKYKSIYVIC